MTDSNYVYIAPISTRVYTLTVAGIPCRVEIVMLNLPNKIKEVLTKKCILLRVKVLDRLGWLIDAIRNLLMLAP
jgi:hypothetical protein